MSGYREKTLNELAVEAYETARAKGFHEVAPEIGKHGRDTRHILSWLMLISTEVAEAAEAIRKGNRDAFVEELADIIIRTLDTCGALNINIQAAVYEKMEKNKTRTLRHGGKLA